MGYAFCVGPCYSCRQTFTFNPMKVPSYPVNGVRQPVCKNCITLANTIREKKGIDLLRYAEDAYEPIDERELP